MSYRKKSKNASWLGKTFMPNAAIFIPVSSGGRPKLEFDQMAQRTKNQATEELRKNHSIEVLLHATQIALHVSSESWHHNLAFLMKQCMDVPLKAGKYRNLCGIVKSSENVKKKLELPQPLSAKESMLYFFEAHHIVESYT